MTLRLSVEGSEHAPETCRRQNLQDVKSRGGRGGGDEGNAQPSSLDTRVAGGAGEEPREEMGLTGRRTSIFGKSRTTRSLWIPWRSVQWVLVCGSLEHRGPGGKRETRSGQLRDGRWALARNQAMWGDSSGRALGRPARGRRPDRRGQVTHMSPGHGKFTPGLFPVGTDRKQC